MVCFYYWDWVKRLTNKLMGLPYPIHSDFNSALDASIATSLSMSSTKIGPVPCRGETSFCCAQQQLFCVTSGFSTEGTPTTELLSFTIACMNFSTYFRSIDLLHYRFLFLKFGGTSVL